MVKFFSNLKTLHSRSEKKRFTQKLLKLHKIDLLKINPRGQLLGRNTLQKDISKGNQNSLEPRPSKNGEFEIEETKVGKRLSDLTTQRVSVLVLILTILSSFFFASSWTGVTYDYFEESQILSNFISNNISNSEINDSFSFLVSHPNLNNRGSLLQLNIPFYNLSYSSGQSLDEIRVYDIVNINFGNNQNYVFGFLDISQIRITNSMISIAKTFYICIILLIGGYLFNSDVTKLVLNPLQQMIQKVKRIKEDPLNVKDHKQKMTFQERNNEVRVIEEAILKIVTLLALGYGQAGAQIIAKNMNSSGNIDPLCKGKREYAIFGFCDIRNFTDTTEILEEDVMLFVNNIGRIVHSYVDIYGGSANKNIGDAFLLVWKFPQQNFAVEKITNEEEKIIPGELIRNLCDMALFSFIKILAHLNSDPIILRYRENVKLQERIPEYKVNMGMGLHTGWAIEGAIGSDFKIDASYLSPHVNMAARLESATKQYGKTILMSSNFVCLCSKVLRNYMREIDNVTLKGSNVPVRLYTIDIDFNRKISEPNKIYIRKLVELRKAKNFFDFLHEGKRAKVLLQSDFELDNLFKSIDMKYRENFLRGYDSYLGGNWQLCKIQFDALRREKYDGPTETLMKHIESYNFQAPEEWQGFRELMEK